jgi:hypothetical protein
MRAARNELKPGQSCRRSLLKSRYASSVSLGSSRISMSRRSAVRRVWVPPQQAVICTGVSESSKATVSSQTSTVAAPTLIAQHSRKVIGSETMSLSSTSWTVYRPGFCEYGEKQANSWFFTAIFARVSWGTLFSYW